MVFLTIASGAVAALAGTLVQHYIGTVRRRQHLVHALHTELLYNYHRATEERNRIESGSWSGTLDFTYHDDTYRAIRTGDPALYTFLTKRCTTVVTACIDTEHWQTEYRISRQPDSDLAVSEDTLVEWLDDYRTTLEEAMDQLQTELDGDVRRRVLYGRRVEAADLSEVRETAT